MAKNTRFEMWNHWGQPPKPNIPESMLPKPGGTKSIDEVVKQNKGRVLTYFSKGSIKL
jgi:hypothetical protein